MEMVAGSTQIDQMRVIPILPTSKAATVALRVLAIARPLVSADNPSMLVQDWERVKTRLSVGLISLPTPAPCDQCRPLLYIDKAS